MSFGYLVPEFPGQTHTFFWRELAELRKLGLAPDIVSTRLPRTTRNVHGWALDAEQQTYYLAPPRLSALCRAISVLWKALFQDGGMKRVVADIAPEVHRVRSVAGLFSSLIHLVKLSLLLLAAGLLIVRARERDWTHLHVHFCSSAAQIALFAHLLVGLPYSMTLHGALADYGPNQRQKWRHSDFVIVITQTLLHEVEMSLQGSLPPVVAVAPMGVNVVDFSRESLYEPWAGVGTARIFSCARLNPSKGHDDVIRALKIVINSGVDAELTIAGEDETRGEGYRRVLEQQITALGLEDRVHLIGAISEARVCQELEMAHVFVLASHAEAFGIATAEAMSLCLPVVVTDAGGVKELVRDGDTGLLVPPNDPGCLAEGILRVLRSPELATGLAHAGRRSVEQSFQSSRSALLLAKLLQQDHT